ncbi:hypothetical protein M0813_03402 [Anaeramoeba flamelloides]|uniref:B box-type domain-containing protein n=1 Tax=Anaeramoeba flamelloides TaxID=1746091 RepID=A0ABQ8XWK8_9EUKA|nr:hypothetical protein M0813_03402 [Anaeramoeba flamelloides]
MTTNLPIQLTTEEEKETIWCDTCLQEDNKKVSATVYCHDCKQNLCEQCDFIHKVSGYRKHKRDLIKDDNSSEKCPIHQNSKLSRYCKNCQKLICSECVFEHSNHEIISFDQSMDFYKELINEQKQCIQNHFERINENFEQLNNSEKNLKKNKETILKEISNFYLKQKNLLNLLEQNEIKLTKDFFQETSISMKIEKQMINNSKYSTKKLLNKFTKLETNINQSNTFEFFRLFSKMQLTKTQEKQNSQFPRLCNEHKNLPFEFFCFDHKQLLCSHCAILNHTNCQKSNNFKEGYEKIQNELEEIIKGINSINEKKLEFVQKIQNEKTKTLKEKQTNIDLIKNKYQKLNEEIQHQFKNMNEKISIQQNEKYTKLKNQSNEIQKEIDTFEKSQLIIKEIAICQKYNKYQEILINYFKLKKLIPILNDKTDQLICDSKFDKINFISNDLKDNLKDWKLNLPYNLNKTQVNVPDEIQLEKKLQFSILLKNESNEIVNAQEFNLKVEILKSNSNEMITEITNFQEGKNQESIGEHLFQKEGEYQINFLINDQKFPKSHFNLKVIDLKLFLKESEILRKEDNPKFNRILEKWINQAGCNSNFPRRLNSRTDGWEYQSFHEKCDNKGKSIVLIKLKNKSLFGGFAAVDWDSKGTWKQSKGNKSFLFSLISLDPTFKEPLKMPVFRNRDFELYCHPSYGPIWGRGHDLILGFNTDNNLNNNTETRSRLGCTYKPPFGYTYRSDQAKNFLAGSWNNWDISQIEIFCEN